MLTSAIIWPSGCASTSCLHAEIEAWGSTTESCTQLVWGNRWDPIQLFWVGEQVIFEELYGQPTVNEYNTALTDFIIMWVEDCVPTKSVKVVPNRKTWIPCEVHSMVKSKSVVRKLDDPILHRKSSYDLCKVIRDFKRQFWIILESHNNIMDICWLW